MRLPAVLLLALATAAADAVRVLHIGIDGLGGDWLLSADAPVLHGLMANGSSTLSMQNVIPTSSSQNWFSMVGGAGPDQHGVYNNFWRRGDSDQTPSMFSVVRDNLGAQAKIGAFYHWDGFGRLVEDEPVIDVKSSPGDERATADAAMAWLVAEQPDLLFVHFDHVDAAGHSTYWGSPEYMAAISRADGLVGELVDTLKRVGLYDDTVIVIAADHGGGQTGTHGRDAEPLRNVPFIISGPGILQNKTIDEREVRIFDVGATVVEVFGFSRPESWIATPVYEVFRSYVPPVAPPSSSPRITYVSEYQHVYDTSGELNAFLSTFSIWRPIAPAGYVALGDVVVAGYDAPTFQVPVVADDADVVRPPAGSERIWTNSGFYSKNYVVTLWQPIPQFGDVCMGTVAVANDLSTEPDRSTIRCISAQFLLQADGVLAGRNTGWSAVELGFWVSLWTAQHPTGAGISTHAFISRRDLAGPGFNKFFVLDESKAVIV